MDQEKKKILKSFWKGIIKLIKIIKRFKYIKEDKLEKILSYLNN